MTKEEDKDKPEYLFSNIDEVFEHIHNSGWTGIHTLAYTCPVFEAMEMEKDWMVYAPMPIHPLFRGERLYHDVCKPSLYRRSWTEAQKLERLVQIEDFKHILDDNPEIKELKQGNLHVNYMGLAQHYGIETDMLDLTNSPLVAAYFATTEYDSLKDEYRPVEDYVSIGCIYFDTIGTLGNMMLPGERGNIYPVGMEALRRPGEQRGFTIKLGETDNLNTIPAHPIRFRFIQNKQCSYRIFQATNGGRIFFPYDPMAEKVRIMRKYRIYGEDSLLIVVENEKSRSYTYSEALKLLSDSGCSFEETTPFLYTSKEKRYINEEYHKKFPNA